MTQRHDLYGPIHKALRAQGAALLVRLGQADPTDERQRRELIGAVRRHLERISMHLWHEEEFVHPLLGKHDEGLEVLMAEEHCEHTRLAAEVREALDGLALADGADAAAAARELYLAMSLLLAQEFTHMQREETLVQPRLQQAHDDATLRETEARILASMSPRETRELLALVLPALNPAEQRTLLLGLPAGARP